VPAGILLQCSCFPRPNPLSPLFRAAVQAHDEAHHRYIAKVCTNCCLCRTKFTPLEILASQLVSGASFLPRVRSAFDTLAGQIHAAGPGGGDASRCDVLLFEDRVSSPSSSAACLQSPRSPHKNHKTNDVQDKSRGRLRMPLSSNRPSLADSLTCFPNRFPAATGPVPSPVLPW